MPTGLERKPDYNPAQVFALTILRRPRYRPAKPGANPEPGLLASGSGWPIHTRLHRGNPPPLQPADPFPEKPVNRPRRVANRKQPGSLRSTRVSGRMRGGHAFQCIRTMWLPAGSLESERMAQRCRGSRGHPRACGLSSRTPDGRVSAGPSKDNGQRSGRSALWVSVARIHRGCR